MKIIKNEKGQALAPKTIQLTKNAFAMNDGTDIYWLGNASVMLNSHGTVMMIDPLLEGFDMDSLMDQMPIDPKDVPFLDAVLITHIDNDHFSRMTCADLKGVTKSFHAPQYVAGVMQEELNIPGIGHDILESFQINDVTVQLTPALHNWQNGSKKYQYRYWAKEDYCGYWINTVDGTIWVPGDSKLLPEHLSMPNPDVILFDFSDNDWHITLDGAIQLANTYPNSDLICIHWGCVDAPTMTPFNGNPEDLVERVINPQRIRVLAPGEAFQLEKK